MRMIHAPAWLAALLAVLALVIAVQPFVSPALAQPALVESTPGDGDIIDTAPESINLCFDEAIRTDFQITIRVPNDQTVPYTPLLRSGGECLDLRVGKVPPNVRGEWSLEWRVTSAQSTAPGFGSFQFTVREGSSDAGSGAAADSDGPDLLEVPVITAAAFGIAAFAGLILYAVRRKIGFDMHRPPPEGAGDEHH